MTTSSKAIAIARVSSQGQADPCKVSQDEQLGHIRAWATREGYQLVDSLKETVSGAKDLDEEWLVKRDRPILADAWERLKTGDVQALIYWEPTRFCRDTTDGGVAFAYWLLQSRKHGDGIRFVENEPSRDGDMAALAAFLIGYGGGMELKSQQRRFRMAKKPLFERGELGEGGWPYGYRWDKGKRCFEVVEDEVRVTRLIFDLYASGELPTRAISEELERLGCPSPTGLRVWGTPILSILLRRECYVTGEYQHRYGGETYTIPCPTIIDPATFDRVQAILKRRHANTGPRAKSKALLSGRIFCGICDPQGRPLPYWASAVYQCAGRKSVRSNVGDGRHYCTNRSISVKRADRLVWEAMVATITDRQSFKQAAEKRLAELGPDIARLQGAVGNLDAQDAQLEKEIVRSEELYRRTGRESNLKRAVELTQERERLLARKQEVAHEAAELHHLQESAEWFRKVIDSGYSVIEDITELEDGSIRLRQRSGYFRYKAGERRLFASGRREEQTWTKARLLEALSVRVTVHEDRLDIKVAGVERVLSDRRARDISSRPWSG